LRHATCRIALKIVEISDLRRLGMCLTSRWGIDNLEKGSMSSGGDHVAMFQVELKVLEGRQQGKTIPLNVRQFLIGREQDCHLRPNSDLVSRHHCVFTVDDFTVRLRDLGSTNGTFVNDERIQGQVVLKAGDHVAVGKLSFEVVVRQAAPVAAKVGDSSGGSSSRTAAPATAPGIESMETSLDASDTSSEIPVAPPEDTAVIDSYASDDTVGQPPQQQQPAFLPSMGYPPGYGMPQGYPMPGYAPGYPGGYPGYPPGYGPPPGYMQPGYGMQPMMPGYGMAQQQPEAPGSSSGRVEAPPVMLPDPSDTGAKAPPPPATAPPPVEGQAGAAPQSVNPSDAAADIIRSHRNRRPG
jgi:pSer/pThr/pTyr-binding forkhead associated (FHA) protein